MIYAAISHLAGQLNQFLKRTYDLAEDIVMVSNLQEQDGSVTPHVNNKLVVFLANVERDTVPRQASANVAAGVGSFFVGSTPLYLNLYVVVAANFSGNNYPEALKFISTAIGFFQKQPVFDRRSSPDMDRRIGKLILDIENLKIQDLSNLWGVLGGKYLPSVLYKVRMVTIDGDDIIAQLPAVSDPQTSVNR